MYDSYLVVKDTLRNEVVDGKTVGFSFGVRIANYRGNYISLINGFYVDVDGVEYGRDVQSFEVNGKAPRSIDEIEKCCWEHWDMQDMARLHIKKDGGLAAGKHTIKYMECILGAYGYNDTDEEYVKNPPKPGDPRGAAKTSRLNVFELEIKEGK